MPRGVFLGRTIGSSGRCKPHLLSTSLAIRTSTVHNPASFHYPEYLSPERHIRPRTQVCSNADSETKSIYASYEKMSPTTIKTRFLIISDTHGHSPFSEDQAEQQFDISDEDSSGESGTDRATSIVKGFRWPLPKADVFIHCGDLTKGSGLGEFKNTFDMIRKIDAKLKLVIPGNHDMALDPVFWNKYSGWEKDPSEGQPRKYYPALAWDMVKELRDEGIQFLNQGTYDYCLENGAKLRVYASPMTPSFGHWAFQYPRDQYEFKIPTNVDIAMTHGPPYSILDKTLYGDKAGCKALLQSLAAARPRVHCFGHIHEAWGAKLVTWDPHAIGFINEGKSTVIEDLQSVEPSSTGSGEAWAAKVTRRNAMGAERCRAISLSAEDGLSLDEGKQTLFCNAATVNIGYQPNHLPWLVTLDLPQANEVDRQRAKDTAHAGFKPAPSLANMSSDDPAYPKVMETWDIVKRQ